MMSKMQYYAKQIIGTNSYWYQTGTIRSNIASTWFTHLDIILC